VTFAPGEQVKTVAIAVRADTVREGAEKFSVSLSVPVNAPITRNQGICTITDDDGP
jgi:hypothetical protein